VLPPKKRTTDVLKLSLIALVALTGAVYFVSVRKPIQHSVRLNWHAAVPRSTGTVKGYDVYRSTTPGGPYVRLASVVTGLKYDDWLVSEGRGYYYVVTTVDSAGYESPNSNEVKAEIP